MEDFLTDEATEWYQVEDIVSRRNIKYNINIQQSLVKILININQNKIL